MIKKIIIGIVIILILLVGVTSLIRNVGDNHIKEECLLFINDEESDFPSFGIAMYDRVDELAKGISRDDINYDLKDLTKLQIIIKICQQTQEYDSIGGSTTDNFDKAIYKIFTKAKK